MSIEEMIGIFNIPNYLLFSKCTLVYHIPVLFHVLSPQSGFVPLYSLGKLLFLFQDLTQIKLSYLKNKLAKTNKKARLLYALCNVRKSFHSNYSILKDMNYYYFYYFVDMTRRCARHIQQIFVEKWMNVSNKQLFSKFPQILRSMIL